MQMNGLAPRWASPPGDTIISALQKKGLGVADLVDPLQMSLDEIGDLIKGRLSITISIARVLESTIGGSAGFWIARDAQYLDDSARVYADQWSSELPIAQMATFGWIPVPRDWQERIDVSLDFFDITEVSQFRERYEALVDHRNFRTSQTFPIDRAAAAVWFRACELEADCIELGAKFSRAGFERALEKARSLTWIKRPDVFI